MKTTNETKTYATLAQHLFTRDIYSDLFGDVREPAMSSPNGFHVLSVKPWLLQVQEERNGVWYLVGDTREYFRKEDALRDAERMGIALDYVSHHKDSVRSYARLPK